MDDAVLDLSLGKGGMDGRVKSSQIVCTGDENILYASVFQAVENGSPEFGTLIFAYPHPQDVLSAIQIDPNGNVYCFLHDLPFTADMVVDGIQKHDGVDGLQRPLLPLFGNGQILSVIRLIVLFETEIP